MPQIKDATPFLRHIEAHNRYDPANFVPWHIEEKAVGLIRHDFVPLLAGHATVFKVSSGRIDMIAGHNPEERTKSLEIVSASLAASGQFNIRNEPYRIVQQWEQPSLASIDRGATYFFGTRNFGVHINGFVSQGLDTGMWIARRAMDRAVSPGKLDQIVAGGLPANLTAFETVIKEGHEEAGLDEALAMRAISCGLVSYNMDVPGGVRRDTMFNYDLELPDSFVPHNEDGEVERFDLMPMEKIAEIVATTDDFKPNCNLVIIDFLIRHGLITPEAKGYEALVNGLRRDMNL